MKEENVMGKKYGRLTVISEIESYVCGKKKYRKMRCLCECN